jgi:hypothetical protein
MPTILELFNSNAEDLYGKEIFRIETRGFANPPRVAALVASSPNTLADLVGGQLAGAVGGTANRPSDTIFKKNSALAKPITLTAATTAQLRDAVDGGYGKNGANDGGYVVKTSPSPNSVISDIQQGGSSVAGVATNLGIQGLNKYGSTSGIKQLKKDLSKRPKLKTNGSFGAPLYTNKEPFSKELLKKSNESRLWDYSNSDLNHKYSFEDNDELQDWIKDNRFQNQVPITFQKYGKSTIIPFAGAISGISEDIQPEWSNFRYVGNPFKTYRYQGVERSVKFNLKLYYMGFLGKQRMIQKIDYLKSLAFPDEKVSEFSYSGNQSSQYAFSPNLVFFSIGDLYKNMFGYIESLSFNIDDNVVWSNFNPTNLSDGDNSLYPSVIDASIGIKIIENHGIEDKIFQYNFNGTRVFDKKRLQVLKENEELQNQSDMYEAQIEPFMLERGSISEEPMPLNEQQQVLENYRNMKT